MLSTNRYALAKVETRRVACLWVEEQTFLPTATPAVSEHGKDIPYDDFVAPDLGHAKWVKTILQGIRVSRALILARQFSCFKPETNAPRRDP